MKYTLALLPFYLSCAAPQVEKLPPKTVVVDLDSANESIGPENENEQPEEISYKRIIGFTTDSFARMQRQQNKPVLEGTIYFENSNQTFNYHYESLPFCEPDSKDKYIGKITFEYASFEEIGTKKMNTLTTLTDVAPFGYVDRVELFVDGTVRIPFYANYKAGRAAQQLHEALFRILYLEMEQHTQKNATWENFNLERIVKDKNWATYELHHQLLQSLFSQEPLRWEELKIYNPCGS